MPTRHHLQASIEGILRNSGRKKINFITDDDGRQMSDKQARAELNRLKALGHIYISCSSECVGFDPMTGCPGHEMKENEE